MLSTVDCGGEDTAENLSSIQGIKEKSTIGRDVAVLRTLLSMTQQQMADIMLLSRMSLSRLENEKEEDEIAADTAFRVYYLANEVMNNKCFSEFTRDRAAKLRKRVENELLSPKRDS